MDSESTQMFRISQTRGTTCKGFRKKFETNRLDSEGRFLCGPFLLLIFVCLETYLSRPLCFGVPEKRDTECTQWWRQKNELHSRFTIEISSFEVLSGRAPLGGLRRDRNFSSNREPLFFIAFSKTLFPIFLEAICFSFLCPDLFFVASRLVSECLSLIGIWTAGRRDARTPGRVHALLGN